MKFDGKLTGKESGYALGSYRFSCRGSIFPSAGNGHRYLMLRRYETRFILNSYCGIVKRFYLIVVIAVKSFWKYFTLMEYISVYVLNQFLF